MDGTVKEWTTIEGLEIWRFQIWTFTSQRWKFCWVLWHMPVTITAGKLKQEDYKFQAGLGYTVRPCIKKRKKIKQIKEK